VRLSDVPVGSTVRIERIFRDSVNSRLLGLGFVPGAQVVVVREAPLGNPRVYQIMGKLISLRNEDAGCIEVTVMRTAIPLSDCEPGFYIVTDIHGGGKFRRRQNIAGIEIGKQLQVISTFPITVRTEQGVFRLGRGEASRIILRRVEQWP